MSLSKKQKKALVRQARTFLRTHSPAMADSPGGCVYLSAAMLAVAQLWGVRMVPQGGSAFWQRNGLDFWGYEFVRPSDPKGLPLEIHVWLAIPETQELVDISTGQWRETCAMCEGKDWKAMDKPTQNETWPGEAPPDFMWIHASNPPTNAIYKADADATRRAHEAIHEIWDHWQRGIEIVPNA